MNSLNFGKNLKEILDVLGISEAELAEKTKLTPAAISQIIAAKRGPSLSSICAILEAITIKFERLVR